MRAICKLALYGMNKTDSNSPIILQNITIIPFSHYLTTRQNKGAGFLSKASYFVVRSVFVHMYCMSREKITEQFKIELYHFMSGINRMVPSKIADSGEILDEGKKLMSYEVNTKLWELLSEVQGDDYTFDHVFLTLDWNRLVRSDNCLAMTVNYVQWENDSLVFCFSKTKGDQSVDKSGNPWHVYSNPKNPELCGS